MIKEEELKQISGGFSLSLAASIGALVGGLFAFLIGVADGYTRPYACR